MLTEEEIKRFITDDATSALKAAAGVGQRYYEAEHDILNYRLFYYNADGILVEDTTRTNVKIPHPFFTELVDQLAAYITSFEDNPIQAKNPETGLQDYLDTYFDESFWAEMQDVITGTNAKGFEYLYGFKNEDNRLAFQCADSLGVVEVRARDTDDGCQYVIWHYVDRIDKGQKIVKRIQVHSKDKIWFYTQVDDGKIELDKDKPANPMPNVVLVDDKGVLYDGGSLGFIPFWRLDNNKKRFSGLKPIKPIIDDYDLMECGLSNNLQDFDTPIHVVSGFQGDNLDELQQNLKTKKIIGVDSEGGLDIKTIDVPYQARKAKADEDEKNIYRFGMGFNSSQAGDGNITNVVIRSRYTLLDLKAKKLENRIKSFLKPIIRVVLDEINAEHGTDYQVKDVQIKFEHIIPTNESENAQNDLIKAQTDQVRINSILAAAAAIGDDEVLKAICDVLDLDYEDIQAKMDELNPETNLGNAQTILNGVVTDEQQTETGSAGIS